MSSRPATSTTPPTTPAPELLATDRSDVAVSCGLEHAVVCVLLGGRSSEREVSLTSGAKIAEALRTPIGAEDRRGPARVLEVEVREDGRWNVDGRELAPGAALDALTDVDLFFSGLHGGEGENGSWQGFFACCDRAFTGSGVAASAVGMDKVFTRELMRARGVRVAPAQCLTMAAWNEHSDDILSTLADWDEAGWAVKPRCGGSSVGATLTRDSRDLAEAITTAFALEREVLVEALIEGTEVTGAVLQTPDRGLEALPVVEIRPKPGRFFDYEEKYADSGAVELCPPQGVSESICELVRAASLEAHTTLRCDGFSRSDFIVPLDGSAPVFLELNTLPGMTPRSLLPLAAETVGIDYRTLCLWIASDAISRES